MRGATKLLSSLLDKGPGDAFEIGRDVDAVTGATFSSRGLALAAQEAARTVAERGMARSSAARGRVQLGAPEIVLVLLLAAGAVGRNRPGLSPRTRKLLRAGTLLVSLATIGFLWNRPWVIAFPIRLLAGDWPSWTTHLYWYVLLGSLLLAFNRTGKNAYCPWICPFGAAQDVIGLAGGARKRRIPSALLFTWVKRVLLWLAVLLGLLYRAPGAVSYEVFAAFFRLSGTAFQFAILGIVLVTAVFVSRPFCNWVCPVDTTEQIARTVRVRALRLARSRDRRAARSVGRFACAWCPAPPRWCPSSAGCATVFSPRRAFSARSSSSATSTSDSRPRDTAHRRDSSAERSSRPAETVDRRPRAAAAGDVSGRLPPRRRCRHHPCRRPGTPGTTRPSG